MADLQSRIIVHPEGFDGSGISNENTLSRARLERPESITKLTTMLMGAWNYGEAFPLLQMTEGQTGGSKAIENIEYEYPVMGKRKTTSRVLSSQYGTGDKPGINNTKFWVIFEDRWFPPDSTISNGLYGVSARVMSEPVPAIGGGTRVELQLNNPDKTAFCNLLALQPGAIWGITGGSTVTNSLSVGNWSTVQTPGKRKGQISILRKSYRLAGNIANRMVEFRIKGAKGDTSYWLDFEEFQHLQAWKAMKEEHLWLSEYNRDEFGQIVMLDNINQLPIPIGAGLKQQIPNSTTYAGLTEKLIRNIIGDTMNGTPDTNAMDIMLFCGRGFADEFDQAMKGSSIFAQVAQGSTGQFIQSASGGNLMLGGYFTSYKSVDGHVITLKNLPFLNHGGYADASGVHPVTGRPRSSYEAYFVDASTYDGQKNIMMVHQKGRMELRGLHQGMTALPDSDYTSYRGNAALRLATERDESSVHFLSTLGVQLLRDTNSFKLELSSAV